MYKYAATHPIQKPTQLPPPPLTLLTSTTLLQSSSFSIHPKQLILSLFTHHHNLYLLPSIPNILEHCPLHLTSCKQHTSTIVFIISSETSSFALRIPIFHVSIRTPTYQSGPVISQAIPFCSRMRGYTFLSMVGSYIGHSYCSP